MAQRSGSSTELNASKTEVGMDSPQKSTGSNYTLLIHYMDIILIWGSFLLLCFFFFEQYIIAYEEHNLVKERAIGKGIIEFFAIVLVYVSTLMATIITVWAWLILGARPVTVFGFNLSLCVHIFEAILQVSLLVLLGIILVYTVPSIFLIKGGFIYVTLSPIIILGLSFFARLRSRGIVIDDNLASYLYYAGKIFEVALWFFFAELLFIHVNSIWGVWIIVPTVVYIPIFKVPFLGIKRSNADIKEAVNVVCPYGMYEGICGPLIYGRISDWDTSAVTDMSELFKDNKNFNEDISKWNVSNVTNMQGMFNGASSFNKPLDQWNVGNVTTMQNMFASASAFNQPIGQWLVYKVTDMQAMFKDAIAFNQPLEQWNVGNVISMHGMFQGALSFNQPLGQWNVARVITMMDMFKNTSSFNQLLGQWSVHSVTTMQGMFAHAKSFNRPLGHWNVANVTDMQGMFQGASSFNQSLGLWNVSNVTSMQDMFRDASAFNQPIGQWNVGNVINMRGMFQGVSSFNQPLDQWNVANVTDMDSLVADASGFTEPLNQSNESM